MINRNTNASGRLSVMWSGVCFIGDGLVRLLSFGFFHTTWPIDHARRQMEQQARAAKTAAVKRRLLQRNQLG